MKQVRCGVCSEDFHTQCVLYEGHRERRHRMADRELPWPPAYFEAFEEDEREDDDADGQGEIGSGQGA